MLKGTGLAVVIGCAMPNASAGQEGQESIVHALEDAQFVACGDEKDFVVVGWQTVEGGSPRGLGRLAGFELRLDGDRLTALSKDGVLVLEGDRLVAVTDDAVQSLGCAGITDQLRAAFADIDWAKIAESQQAAKLEGEKRESAAAFREGKLDLRERDLNDRELLVRRREEEAAALRTELAATKGALRTAEESLAAANRSLEVKAEWIETLNERVQAAEARVKELEGK